MCVRHGTVNVCFCMDVQVSVTKRSRKQGKRQKAEGEKDALMNEHKEEESCKMASQIASMAEQQQNIKLTEAHRGQLIQT